VSPIARYKRQEQMNHRHLHWCRSSFPLASSSSCNTCCWPGNTRKGRQRLDQHVGEEGPCAGKDSPVFSSCTASQIKDTGGGADPWASSPGFNGSGEEHPALVTNEKRAPSSIEGEGCEREVRDELIHVFFRG
jgi:hypothetical protein